MIRWVSYFSYTAKSQVLDSISIETCDFQWNFSIGFNNSVETRLQLNREGFFVLFYLFSRTIIGKNNKDKTGVILVSYKTIYATYKIFVAERVYFIDLE